MCCGFVVGPVKCDKCNKMYCSACLPDSAFNPSLRVRYPNKPYECFMKCGSRKTTQLSKIEKAILNSLPFSCQFDECDETLKYSDYFDHLRTAHNITIPCQKERLAEIEKKYQKQLEEDRKRIELERKREEERRKAQEARREAERIRREENEAQQRER